jgi:two-component sensor histidine kinase
MGADLPLLARRADRTEFPVDIMLSPIEIENRRLVLAVVRDVTERKQAEEQRQEVARHEALLREVHHRVKNNLQVVSSMLNLEGERSRKADVANVLSECQQRIASIALVHEKLYRSDALGRIEFASYVEDLVGNIVRSHGGTAARIGVDFELAPLLLNLDTAVPCGLMVNELVSNALKHAFPESRGGRIHVGLVPDDGRYRLVVEDDGKGFPAGFDLEASDTLGLKLVHILADQLDASIAMARPPGGGSRFTVEFKEIVYKERH